MVGTLAAFLAVLFCNFSSRYTLILMNSGSSIILLKSVSSYRPPRNLLHSQSFSHLFNAACVMGTLHCTKPYMHIVFPLCSSCCSWSRYTTIMQPVTAFGRLWSNREDSMSWSVATTSDSERVLSNIFVENCSSSKRHVYPRWSLVGNKVWFVLILYHKFWNGPQRLQWR